MPASTAVDTSYPALRKLWDVRDQLTSTPEQAAQFDNVLVSILSSRLPKAEWESVVDLAALHYREMQEASRVLVSQR
jgi:hypothetical protein